MGIPVVYSFVLSQIFGLFLFIYAILMFSRPDLYRNRTLSFKSDSAVITIGGLIALFLSIALVVTHTIWVYKPRLIVTILCWIFFIKILLWLIIPEKMLKITHKIYKGVGYYILASFMLIFGILLFIGGFHVLIYVKSI